MFVCNLHVLAGVCFTIFNYTLTFLYMYHVNYFHLYYVCTYICMYVYILCVIVLIHRISNHHNNNTVKLQHLWYVLRIAMTLNNSSFLSSFHFCFVHVIYFICFCIFFILFYFYFALFEYYSLVLMWMLSLFRMKVYVVRCLNTKHLLWIYGSNEAWEFLITKI